MGASCVYKPKPLNQTTQNSTRVLYVGHNQQQLDRLNEQLKLQGQEIETQNADAQANMIINMSEPAEEDNHIDLGDNRVQLSAAVSTPEKSLTATLSKHNKRTLMIGEFFLYDERHGDQFMAHRLKKVDSIIKKIVQTVGPSDIKRLVQKLTNEIEACIFFFFIKDRPRFSRLLVKGLPMKYRWNFWKVRLGPDDHYVQGLYEKFSNLTCNYTAEIKRDLHRVYPEEPYFSPNSNGRIQLENVLKAVSIYYPNLGYSQGISYIIGFFLLVNGGKEEEAFWMFIALARHPDFLVMGFFENRFPLLDFYNFICDHLMQREVPKVFEHIKGEQIPDVIWKTKWLQTLFLSHLPMRKVVRIWDFILSEDLFGVLKIIIAIVKQYEKEFMEFDINGVNDLAWFLKSEKPVRDPNSQSVSSFVFHTKEVDIDTLIKTAKKVTLSDGQITYYCLRFLERQPRYSVYPYYKYYSSYENNSKSKNYHSTLQKEVDLKIMRHYLIGSVSSEKPKKEQQIAIESPANLEHQQLEIEEDGNMILKDLESEINEPKQSDDFRNLHDVEEQNIEYDDDDDDDDEDEDDDQVKIEEQENEEEDEEEIVEKGKKQEIEEEKGDIKITELDEDEDDVQQEEEEEEEEEKEDNNIVIKPEFELISPTLAKDLREDTNEDENLTQNIRNFGVKSFINLESVLWYDRASSLRADVNNNNNNYPTIRISQDIRTENIEKYSETKSFDEGDGRNIDVDIEESVGNKLNETHEHLSILRQSTQQASEIGDLESVSNSTMRNNSVMG